MLMMLAGLTFSCGSTDRVDSGAYDLMLQMLLEHSTNQISVDSLVAIKERVVLLHARSREEYEVSHIPGARWVGYPELRNATYETIPRDSTVIVYCSVGYRSEKAVQALEKEGFSHIANVYGGIFEWVNRGYPVVNDSGRTSRIHGYSSSWGFWLEEGEVVY